MSSLIDGQYFIYISLLLRQITQCLLDLCDCLEIFFQQRQAIEQIIIKKYETFSYDVDLKSIVSIGEISRLFDRKCPKMLNMLYRNLNPEVIKEMIRQIEAQEGLLMSYEFGTMDLHQSIDGFRDSFIDFMNNAAGEFKFALHLQTTNQLTIFSRHNQHDRCHSSFVRSP